MWLTLGGGGAASLGWLMVTQAATFSLVWCIGGLLLVGGVICLIPAAFIIGGYALYGIAILVIIAAIVVIVYYFAQNLY